MPAVIETARDLGIQSKLAPVPAMVLGASEVTPVELARAFLPFANGGVRHDALSAVTAVYQENGARLDLSKSDAVQVVPSAEAYLVTSLLQGVITAGTASSARGLSIGVSALESAPAWTSPSAASAWLEASPGSAGAWSRLTKQALRRMDRKLNQPLTVVSALVVSGLVVSGEVIRN